MNQDPIRPIRREAKRRLMNYRRTAGRWLRGSVSAEDARQTQWNLAVEHAMRVLKLQSPVKARLFSRLFGLETPIPRGSDMRERVIRLSMDFHVAESTVYAWREDGVQLVVSAAIEAGICAPFGIAPGMESLRAADGGDVRADG